MCGITGFVGFDDKTILKRMCDIIHHRGPNDRGTYSDNNVSLGSLRLSIIDLASGHQPIHNEDESVWITYNGEIYNYLVLKKELEALGHRFYTDTDTEVIVHAYEEYGEKCVEKLRGMFAFALWDSDKKQVLLARDRMGIKPLYYYFDGERLIFASEIKSILKCSDIKRSLSTEGLKGFLIFGYTPGKTTIFDKIYKLLPGNILNYNLKLKEIKIQEYWNLDFSDIHKDTELYLLKSVTENLRDSVNAHLVSDVPIGVFLSGGIDSSSIATLMNGLTNSPIKTFTIGFEDQSYDESIYARRVAETLGTEHYEKIISPDETLDIIAEIAPSLDEPFGDASMFPTYLISKWASKEVKVVLDGNGGDEILAGYHWYKAQRIWGYYAHIPKKIRSMALLASKLVKVGKSKKGARTFIKRFLEGTEFESNLNHVRWKIPNFKKEIFPGNWTEVFDETYSHFNYAKNWDPINQMLYVDIKTSLPDNMLTKVDKMSMLNSIEVRVPFLDHKFVEFTTKIPPSFKLKNLKTKYILKKAMEGLIPKDNIYRSKQGFSIPMKNWMKGELQSTMEDLISKENVNKRGYFDWYHVNKLIEQHIRDESDNWNILWRLMSFEIWHRNYLDS